MKLLNKQSSLLVCLALWVLTTGYIWLFPTRHYTPDAVNNLLFIEQQNTFELWHSQHLLAQWPGFWLYRLAGGALRAWEAMRLAHGVLAGATVAMAYATIDALTAKRRIAMIGALALWFSYGFWHYESDPDIYSAGYAAVALLMFAFVFYLLAPSVRRAGALGGAGALAILSHQLNVELAGLIGLSLAWMAWKTRSRGLVKHLITYAGVVTVVVAGVYVAGWMSAGGYLVAHGDEMPSFAGWALGYFAKAQQADVTWGGALSLNNLPLAGYTFLLSWVLPPLATDISVWSGMLLMMLLVSVICLVGGIVAAARRLTQQQHTVALVCGATIAANGISGWWWQPGNAKFYLFMQINLIILLALYAALPLQGVWGRVRQVAICAAFAALSLYHVTESLPYETRGGVFAVAEIARDRPVTVGFDSPLQAEIFSFIQEEPGYLLPSGFCDASLQSLADLQLLWVARERDAANCSALSNATEIGAFQADRTREVWGIFNMGIPAPTEP